MKSTGPACSAVALLVAGASAKATPRDFDFRISYSGQYISGRLVGLDLDTNGNGTEVDPTEVLLFHVPSIVGLPASPSQPYVFTPHTFMRSTPFSGTFSSTTPGVYGFQISNNAILVPAQNLVMVEASGDVTLVFNFGQGYCYECGDATYGIMAEEDALWPAVNSFVSYTLVPLCADVNGDNEVDLFDLSPLLSALGTSGGDPAYDAGADLDSSGTVDLRDISALQIGFGTTCTPG